MQMCCKRSKQVTKLFTVLIHLPSHTTSQCELGWWNNSVFDRYMLVYLLIVCFDVRYSAFAQVTVDQSTSTKGDFSQSLATTETANLVEFYREKDVKST